MRDHGDFLSFVLQVTGSSEAYNMTCELGINNDMELSYSTLQYDSEIENFWGELNLMVVLVPLASQVRIPSRTEPGYGLRELLREVRLYI